MARPQIIANGGSPGVKASVSAASGVTLTLDSLVGVRSIQWQILSTDETHSVGDYPLTISGSIGQQADFNSAGPGTAVIAQVMVNNGLVRGVFTPDQTMNTIKVFVPTVDNLEVGATGEQYESDPEHGTTGIINGIIRAYNAISTAQYAQPTKAVYVVETANLALSGNATIDGISVNDGDVVLAVGQTAPAENGIYDVDTGGAWTRSLGFDSDQEIRGAVVIVAAGTLRAGWIYQNTNAPSVVVGTTAITFARMPDRFDKAKLDAATSTPTLNTIAMWDGAAAMNATSFKGPGLISALGILRSAYNATIVSALDSTGLIDLSVLSTVATDRAQLGSTSCAGANVAAASGGNVQLVHGGVTFATISSSGGYVFGPASLFKILQTAPAGTASGQDADVAAQDAATNGDGGDLRLRSGNLAGSGSPGDVLIDARTFEIVVRPKGLSIGANPGDFGTDGDGVIFIADATTPPSGTPAGGGILYADAGALFWKSSGGTVTEIGPV